MELYIQQESTQPITLNSVLNPFSKALIGAQWLFFKSGLGATNHFEAAAFVRSRAGVDYPDIQYHFIPAAVRYDGKAAAKSHGFQAHVGPMRSKSRGSVMLRSPDPQSKPVIRFNYMSHPDDWTEFRHCIRLTREIFGAGGIRPLSRQGDLAGRRTSSRTTSSTASSASTPRAPTILAAPAGWAVPTTR